MRLAVSLCSSFGLALFAIGCGGSTLREPAYGPQILTPDQWVDNLETPPPSVEAEEIRIVTDPAYVWIDGQWTYQPLTKRWTWEQGAWCVPPPGAVYYAKPVVERKRVVAGRIERWNEALARYEQVDSGDDVWRWARGRFYVRRRDGVIAPGTADPFCLESSSTQAGSDSSVGR